MSRRERRGTTAGWRELEKRFLQGWRPLPWGPVGFNEKLVTTATLTLTFLPHAAVTALLVVAALPAFVLYV